MLAQLALVSVMAAPVPGDSPPPSSSLAPTVSTTSTTVVAPAPAPAPAPAATTTTTVAPGGPEQTTVTTSSGGTTTTTSVVIVTRPPPSAPPPVVVQARPVPPIPHDPWRTRQDIRTFRRRAVGVMALGSLGMVATLGSQWMRARDLQQCLGGPPGSAECMEADELDSTYAAHGMMGAATFIVGTAWAGKLLGRAAATRDVLQRGRQPRSRPGLKLLGFAAIAGSTAWMIGANYTLLKHESACDGHHGCIAKYRPLRWAANDGAAVGMAFGSGLLGYGVAYQRHGRAIARVRAAPAVAATQAGMSLSVEF